ncbi:MAG: hypothetical protein K2L55_03130 [Muribaculaceae bacterium]|nr:hypothetical protein [Muribaculaceae bacterium]
MRTGLRINIKSRFLKSVFLIAITCVAGVIAAIPENIFSVAIGNDIMMSTRASFDSAKDGARTPIPDRNNIIITSNGNV